MRIWTRSTSPSGVVAPRQRREYRRPARNDDTDDGRKRFVSMLKMSFLPSLSQHSDGKKCENEELPTAQLGHPAHFHWWNTSHIPATAPATSPATFSPSPIFSRLSSRKLSRLPQLVLRFLNNSSTSIAAPNKSGKTRSKDSTTLNSATRVPKCPSVSFNPSCPFPGCEVCDTASRQRQLSISNRVAQHRRTAQSPTLPILCLDEWDADCIN